MPRTMITMMVVENIAVGTVTLRVVARALLGK